MKFAFAIALALLAPSAAFAADSDPSRLECNFRALTAAQRDAQTSASAHRIPALLGPVDGAMTPVPLDGVYISDSAIERKVMAQDVFAHRTANKSVEVTVRIVNCTDYPLQLRGRVSFMDANQFPTEDTSAWQPVFLQPRSIGSYREVSLGGANVASYLVELISNR